MFLISNNQGDKANSRKKYPQKLAYSKYAAKLPSKNHVFCTYHQRTTTKYQPKSTPCFTRPPPKTSAKTQKKAPAIAGTFFLQNLEKSKR